MQINSCVNNEMEDQELTLDTVSPIWAKRLEESKLLPLLSLRRLRLYLELKRTSKCVVGEAYGFSSSYIFDCKLCSKIAWKFMFYFMIYSYTKLEQTKKEFVKHWSEKHHHNHQLYPTCREHNVSL
jgi:vacuolar-type H+-ATPase subunit I/STV1